MKIIKCIMLCFFFMSYVLGDFIEAKAQNQKTLALFNVTMHGVSDMSLKTLLNSLKYDPSLSRELAIIDYEELNTKLESQNQARISPNSTSEEIIKLSKTAGVRWIITGELGRVRGMHLLTLKIIDTESGVERDAMSEEEPGTIENLTNSILKEFIQRLLSLVSGENLKTQIITKKPKSNKTLYILLGVLVAGGAGAAAATLGGKGGGTTVITSSDLPGSPPGPPSR